MTSQKVMLVVMGLMVCLWATGCETPPPGADALHSPYSTRRVWAIAPLKNESGSLHADGVRMADKLAVHLEGASNLDLLPVNRTLQAMESLQLRSIDSEADALLVLRLLGCDGLVIGTISAYDPYDPPKLGMILELFAGEQGMSLDAVDIRKLTSAATADQAMIRIDTNPAHPRSIVSAILDASAPDVRERLERFAGNRGVRVDKNSAHLYRISMDHYTDFACYVMSWRLLREEARRLHISSTPQPKSPS